MSINRRDLDAGKVVVGILEGGHKDDPDPLKMGRGRYRVLSQHGPNVKTDDLPFVQPVAHRHNETPRVPRPGQLAQLLQLSDGYYHVLGTVGGIMKDIGNLKNLVPQIKQAIETSTGVKIPPNIKSELEENITGLSKMVKTVVEKGIEEAHSLFYEIPSHGASPSLAGLINNPIRQVSTALTEFESILNSSILSQLPAAFSIGNILNEFTGEQIQEVMDAIPAEIQTAFTNLMRLKQGDLGGSMPGNFVLGGIMNPATFLPNLVTNLKKVTNFTELENTLNSAMADVMENRAAEGLENIIQDIEGVFGAFQKTISPLGIIESIASEAFTNLLNQFTSQIAAIPSAANSLFNSDTNIPTLINRLKTNDVIKAAKENLENKHPNNNTKRNRVTDGGSAGTTLGSRGWLA